MADLVGHDLDAERAVDVRVAPRHVADPGEAALARLRPDEHHVREGAQVDPGRGRGVPAERVPRPPVAAGGRRVDRVPAVDRRPDGHPALGLLFVEGLQARGDAGHGAGDGRLRPRLGGEVGEVDEDDGERLGDGRRIRLDRFGRPARGRPVEHAQLGARCRRRQLEDPAAARPGERDLGADQPTGSASREVDRNGAVLGPQVEPQLVRVVALWRVDVVRLERPGQGLAAVCGRAGGLDRRGEHGDHQQREDGVQGRSAHRAPGILRTAPAVVPEIVPRAPPNLTWPGRPRSRGAMVPFGAPAHQPPQSRTTRSIIGRMTQQFARVPDRCRRRRPRGPRLRWRARGRGSSATCARTPRRFSIAIVGLRHLVAHRARRSRWSSPGSRPRSSRAATRPGSTAWSSLLFGLFCVQAVGSFLQTYLLGVVGERVVAQLRGDLFGRLVTLSLDFHASTRVGELVSRLSSDVTLVRTMLTQTVTSLLSSVIGLIGSVIILFTLSPTLLLIVLLLAPALIAVAIVFGRPLQRVSTAGPGHHRAEHDHRRGGAVRHPRGQELRPRGLGARALRRGPAEGRHDGIAARAVAGGVRGADGLPRVRRPRGPALVHRPPGHRRRARDRHADRVPAVRRRDRRQPRARSPGCTASSARGPGRSPGCSRSSTPRPTIVDAPDAAADRPRSPAGSSSTACRSATAPDRLVLRDIDLDVGAGETLALVGPSGSGKTTLIGPHPPAVGRHVGGSIRVDGTDVRDVTVGEPARADRPRGAGGDAVRRHHPREHPVRAPRRDRGRDRRRGPGRQRPRLHQRACPTATTPSSATAARACRAASASAWPSPGRS